MYTNLSEDNCIPKSQDIWGRWNIPYVSLKPLYTFGSEKKRFSNNLQGLHKVMVKDFPWNIVPWNALLFENTLKQYQFSIARITDLL